MDSPGFSAQFCSYVSIENNTKKIVSMLTLDKRETEKKSPCLEKEGFVRSMAAMEQKGLNVVEVVTDAHMSIGAVMSKYDCNNNAVRFLYICDHLMTNKTVKFTFYNIIFKLKLRASASYTWHA